MLNCKLPTTIIKTRISFGVPANFCKQNGIFICMWEEICEIVNKNSTFLKREFLNMLKFTNFFNLIKFRVKKINISIKKITEFLL